MKSFPSIRLLTAVFFSLAFCVGNTFAQQSEEEAIRQELDAAKELIKGLEARLDALKSSNPDEADEVIVLSEDSSDEQPPPPLIISGCELENVRPLSDSNVPLIAGRTVDQAERGSSASFDLSAGTGGGRASLALTSASLATTNCSEPVNDGDTVEPSSVSGPSIKTKENVWALSLSAPLSKDGKTPFATLDGLQSGTKAKLSFSRLYGNVPSAQFINSNYRIIAARAECNARKPKYKNGCTRIDDEFLDEFLPGEELADFYRRLRDRTLTRSFGFTGSVALGYDEYSYYPSPDLEKTTDEEFSYSASAGVLVFPWISASAQFDAEYQKGFKAANASTTCPVSPDEGEDFLTCVPGPRSAPSRVEKFILATELRQLVHLEGRGLIDSFGIAPRFEFDTKSDDLAFDFPVYLVTDKKNGLVGGFRVGYEEKDDEDDVKFGVFVGKAFSLFPE